ncbi:methylmalonic aciduria and homocystinuria type D protein [Oculatella sp. LEGE 06141]|uniref:methylmalonic aciduria and homocystinuria type D protein n=1 Tax=Oculatella sp. LEGE 06141 TaxID=1828648 RepID=UPI0018828E0D|nr:methylmalonic aciduria and homocystinuria type D protein [Oculatella sp. LEGE 06141]MBE9179269.1 methylmalonic aciduria and homocystinuria type D protein [Oculatella sp. LEGE 06141]
MQYSIHSPSPYLHRHSSQLLPGWSRSISSVLVVLQPCPFALIDRTVEIEQSKHQLRQDFVTFGMRVAARLTQMNQLVELFDPRTGWPMLSAPGSLRLDDVAVVHALLGYDRISSGGCSMVLHPVWGNAVYPAILVSSAHPERLEEVVGAIAHPSAPLQPL